MERIEPLWRLFWTRALSTEMTPEGSILAVLMVFVAAIVCLPLTDFAFPMFFGGHPAPPLTRKDKVALVTFVTAIPISLSLLYALVHHN